MLRIALYLVGIIVLALGITLNTKTNLGVSPIISIPYAVAQIFGYETGTAVFVAYLIFIVLQIVLLKGKFPPFQLLQVAASYLTSAFITIFDRVLPVPEQMGSRLLVLALAIGMIGAGRPVGIGIGTVVAMVCTGRVIALFNHLERRNRRNHNRIARQYPCRKTLSFRWGFVIMKDSERKIFDLS